MMIESALKAAPSQSGLHGQGKLSENALEKLVLRKNSEWGHVFRLWCRLDCPHEQVENQRFWLAMLDLPNRSTYSWLELFESIKNVRRQDWRGGWLAWVPLRYFVLANWCWIVCSRHPYGTKASSGEANALVQ